MSALDLHYVCSDRGIALDGHKGASVHLREMGRALARGGFAPRLFVARHEGDIVDGLRFDAAHRWRLRDRGAAGELGELFAQQSMAELLASAPSPAAVLERYSLFGLAGLHHALRHDVPFVLEVNAPLWEEAARYRSLSLHGLATSVAQELLRRADHVLAVSAPLRVRLIEAGARPERTHVFSNGVAPAFATAGAAAELPRALRGRPVLAFVGSLKPWHGIDFVLDALERGELGEVAVWVVGDGPLRGRVQESVRRIPHQVQLEGAVEHERVASILRACDGALAPYLPDAPDYFCPLKVLEALCVGVPLVAADVVAVRHAVPAGAEVFGFEAGSTKDLRRAIGVALTRGHQEPSAFDPAGCTWDARARDLARILERGVAPPSRTSTGSRLRNGVEVAG